MNFYSIWAGDHHGHQGLPWILFALAFLACMHNGQRVISLSTQPQNLKSAKSSTLLRSSAESNQSHGGVSPEDAFDLLRNLLILLLANCPAAAFQYSSPAASTSAAAGSHARVSEKQMHPRARDGLTLLPGRMRAGQLRLTAPNLESERMLPEVKSERDDAGWEVEVRPAGDKGMGVFALEDIADGSWVSQYIGTLSTAEDNDQRYMGKAFEYNFQLDAERGLSIDGQNSTHFSRYINHAEEGNLWPVADSERLRIDFFAARDIKAGEELTFDYGLNFWRYRRQQPSIESDSRDFNHPKYREPPPGLALLYPPPVGTIFSPTPLTPIELLAALALPEKQGREALMRCLEYFGSRRLDLHELSQSAELHAEECAEGDWLEVLFGVGDDVRREVVCTGTVSYSTLQDAAVACIVQAILLPGDPTGRKAHAFEKYVQHLSVDLRLIRERRALVPPLASPAHDAVGLAAHVLHNNGHAHAASAALSHEARNSVCAWLADHQDEGGARQAFATLADECYENVSIQPLQSFVNTLEKWIVMGAGCTVVSNSPPKLSGYVSQDLNATWKRVPILMDYGLLTYDEYGVGTYHPIC